MASNCPGGTGPNNIFGLTQYDGFTSFFGGQPALSQGAGYAMVILFGAVSSLITTVLIWLEYKFTAYKNTSEQFNTAGRTVKTGLIANVVCSQWTWGATVLMSSNVAWQYGVSGAFWYASGGTIQIILFGILAVEIKRKAPNAHTFLEIIRARWDNTAHKVFFVFALMTNVLVTAMLLLGGASVMNALTGINTYAACILIPVGVIMYCALGGLKGSFIAHCPNSFYILITVVICSFSVYASDDAVLGSPSKVWENLNKFINTPVPADAPADMKLGPVPDNKGGSYLTMFSRGGLIFGIINVISNFGTVFVDQSYFLGAIAAKPSASWKGYIMGGLMYFCIPFTLATSLGLGSRAAGLPVNSSEGFSGLVSPATAVYLMGTGGAWLICLLVLMAVTSTANSELVAVSSLMTYDLYRTYINPKATGKDIIRASRYSIVGFGCFMGVLAIVLFEIGVNLGWIYLFMGIAIGGAVFPIYACLTWSKANATGAITGAISGLIAGLVVWLVTAQAYAGSITVQTLGGDYPMLGGNLASIIVSAVVCSVMSIMKPQDNDWQTTREIPLVEEDGVAEAELSAEDSPEAMDKASKVMTYACWGFSIVLVVLWPLLALPAGVFSKGYFTFWVALSMAWGLCALVAGVTLPFWESRHSIAAIAKGVVTCTTTEGEAPSPPKVEITLDEKQAPTEEEMSK